MKSRCYKIWHYSFSLDSGFSLYPNGAYIYTEEKKKKTEENFRMEKLPNMIGFRFAEANASVSVFVCGDENLGDFLHSLGLSSECLISERP